MSSRLSAIQFHTKAIDALKNVSDSGRQSLAYQLFASSVLVDDTFANGFYEVGNANSDMGLMNGAIAAYRKVLELPLGTEIGDATPELQIKACANMGARLFQLGRLEEAEECCVKALSVNPDLSYAWMTLAQVQSVTGRIKESLVSAHKAFKLEPSPQVEFGLGLCLVFAEQWKKGLKHMEARFPYRLPHFMEYPYPKWDGSKGKKLFLVSDQGLGDTLSFSRFVEQAAKRCDFIFMGVHKELARLFAASFAHCKNIEIMPQPCPFAPADYWSTFMSLPVHMNLTDKQFVNAPGIKIPPFSINKGWKVPNKKLHIGVAWEGSKHCDINHWRSFPVEMILELYQVQGIQLYSIQTGEAAKRLHDIGAAALVKDMAPYINDVADTIGIMSELDLLITTESAPGHMAGAIGLETWVPYSYNGNDFRIGRSEKGSIWYPRQKIFKQGKDAQWGPVFNRIVHALDARLKQYSPR